MNRFWGLVRPVPARCRGVELRPCVSLQLMFSGLQSFWTRARHPFFAASSRAASPLSRSWMSVSPSFTMSRGVFPSRFFLVGSAPCWGNQQRGLSCIAKGQQWVYLRLTWNLGNLCLLAAAVNMGWWTHGCWFLDCQSEKQRETGWESVW